MTLMQEIALRQSLMFGGLITGLVLGLIFAVFLCYRQPSWIKTGFKPLPIIAFFVAGAANFAAPAVLAALAFSGSGDIALSRKGRRAILIGLFAFAITHLIYGLHFVSQIEGDTAPWWIIVAVLGVVISTEFWLTPHVERMKWPVRLYTMSLTFMATTALMIPNSVLPTVGALAFIASSVLFGLRIFRLDETSRWAWAADVAAWLFYLIAQAAILAGTGFANPLFSI